MFLQFWRDKAQLMRDYAEDKKTAEKLIKRQYRYATRVSPVDVSVLNNKKYSYCMPTYEELFEWFRVTAIKLCKQKKLPAPTEYVVLGRMGLNLGYVESYKELEEELGLSVTALQSQWAEHGKQIQEELKKIYYA